MDLWPELRAFRDEMRAWIAANAVPGPAWERRLLEARLVCPQWPEEAGGRGWDTTRLAVFEEECHLAGAARVTRGLGESQVGPAVVVHGTGEQRARLLQRIADGRDVYCAGLSEPDHGSDLAGVETRGDVDGNEVVVTGRKAWVSGADRATAMAVLCRTDAGAPRYCGLSYVLLPLRAGGVEVRPRRQMTGGAVFFDVLLDRVRAPLDDVIGGLGGGWRAAMTAVAFERGGRAAVAHLEFEHELWALVETARRYGRDRDPLVRQQLAWAYGQVQILRFQGMRRLAQLAVRPDPGPEASITRLLTSEYHRRFGEIAVDIMGADALLRPGRWQDVFLSSRAGTISSGTSEVQRSILAERALGLPSESLEREVVSGSARR